MKPTLEILELREVPATLVLLPGDSSIRVASAGQEARVTISNGAATPVFDRVVFESSFAGGLNAAVTGDTVFVGANFGGGPRVVSIDWKTGAVIQDVFVGDPESRQGVDAAGVAALVARPGEAVRVAEPPAPLLLDPYSMGWGPKVVQLDLTQWSGDRLTTSWSVGVIADTFDSLADRGIDTFDYTIGVNLPNAKATVRALPGMTPSDLADEILKLE